VGRTEGGAGTDCRPLSADEAERDIRAAAGSADGVATTFRVDVGTRTYLLTLATTPDWIATRTQRSWSVLVAGASCPARVGWGGDSPSLTRVCPNVRAGLALTLVIAAGVAAATFCTLSRAAQRAARQDHDLRAMDAAMTMVGCAKWAAGEWGPPRAQAARTRRPHAHPLHLIPSCRALRSNA
jgi:hypothetical protein